MSTSGRTPPWLAGSGVIAVAMGLMNLGTYGFTLVAARVLGPREYGALAAVMGLLLVLGVLSLGFQATAARRGSAPGEPTAEAGADVLTTAHLSAGLVTLLLLVATPLVAATLRLDPWWSAALVAAAVLPLTLMGAYAGALQGEGRWGALAALYIGMGAGRLVFGVLGMTLAGGSAGALLGVAVGNAVPALVGWLFLRRRRSAVTAARRVRGTSGPRRRVLVEVAHDSHALLAFFAMSNVDVLVARRVLTEHDAGLYAAGLILAKAVLFLPQFVVVLAFPSMVREGRGRMQAQALSIVLGIGVVATAGAWLLAPLAITFVGGDAYDALRSSIWGFAAVGALMAMIQLVVYGAMARQHRTAVTILWAGLVGIVAAAFVVSTVTELLATVAATHATVLLALLVLGRRHHRSRLPTPTAA